MGMRRPAGKHFGGISLTDDGNLGKHAAGTQARLGQPKDFSGLRPVPHPRPIVPPGVSSLEQLPDRTAALTPVSGPGDDAQAPASASACAQGADETSVWLAQAVSGGVDARTPSAADTAEFLAVAPAGCVPAPAAAPTIPPTPAPAAAPATPPTPAREAA